ncbi:tetratricopeptide repeat protein [Prevotella dentasini]
MKNLVRLLSLGILILVCSCGKTEYPQQLLVADSLANVSPDSSLAILQAMSHKMQQEDETVRKFYQLTLYKAKDKAYQPIKNDSSIFSVYSYYKDKGDEQHLESAQYYMGRYYAENGDAPRALDFFRQAYDATESARQKAIIASQMGELATCQKLNELAKKYYRDGLLWATRCNDALRVTYAYLNIAFTYGVDNQRDSALSFYFKALPYAQELKCSQIISKVYTGIASNYTKTGRAKKALPYIQYALKYAMPSDYSAVLVVASELYESLGNSEQEFRCLQELEKNEIDNTRLFGYRSLLNWHLRNGNIDRALEYSRKYFLLNDTIEIHLDTSSVARAQALYDYNLREKENQKLTMKMERDDFYILLICFVGFVLISVSLCFTFINMQRAKLYKDKLYYYLDRMEAYMPKRIQCMEKLRQEKIYKCISKGIGTSDFKMREEEWAELSEAIERILPNHKCRLERLCRINEQEYHLCMLLMLDISLKDIANLTNHSLSSISVNRRRLYKRAFHKEGNPAEWDKIIQSFSF